MPSAEVDKDVVRRVLSARYRPESDAGKDSLWSCDLFRIGNAANPLGFVVMDQFTRRIIGFAVHNGIVDGVAPRRLFHRAIRRHGQPKYQPLYRFHPWDANLLIVEVTEIKTVRYAPLSYPFFERLIGTIGREYLDDILFWTTADLETKLIDFQHFYHSERNHQCKDNVLLPPRSA